MNKYHNRNRIFSPIMTIHDILTLHILSSFLSSLSFLSFFLLSSLSLSFLFFFPFSPSPFLSLSLSLLSLLSSLFPFFFIFPFFLSVFSVFYREGRTLSHHPDVERYCARLSE